MRSLFFKIFLWFGLAMVLVNVASFLTGVITERRSQFPGQNPMAASIGIYAQTAVDVFEKEGTAQLSSYLDRVKNISHIEAVLLNDRAEEVSGRTVPQGGFEVARNATELAPFAIEFRGRPQPIAARLVHSQTGASYTLVAELPRPPFPPPPRLGEPGSFLFGLRLLGQRLLPILFVGALFCYWLARHLSTPIIELRDTTQELADGNFTARVNDTLLKRHDEIGYLGRDFNVMADRIESLVKAQRRLLGDISHELRSPLARQNVAIGLARRHAGVELNGTLDRIAREADRLNEMIGQLLTLSRAEVGTEGLNNGPIDLTALVNEIAENANYEARARDRSVRVIRADECYPNGVVELVSSAIENVVRNAVRYTAPRTEVEISVSCEKGANRPCAIVTVRDQGPGVSEEELAEIFRPFYRVEDARDRKTGGTGLGLSISDRVVRLHGGSVQARNAADGGLVVELRLPIDRLEEQL